MKTILALAAAGLMLLALAPTPTAGAGCTLTQTCAFIVGTSMCSYPSGSCSGSWDGLHRSTSGGTGYFYVNWVLEDTCTLTLLNAFRCETHASHSWTDPNCATLAARTVSSTGEEAWDITTTIGC